MAASDDDSAEFEELGSGGSSNGSLKPQNVEPGEEVTGGLQALVLNAGQYNKPVVVLDDDGEVLTVRVTQGVGSAILDENLAPGTPVKLQRSEDEESFTDDDGQEVTYNPLSIRAARSDD